MSMTTIHAKISYEDKAKLDELTSAKGITISELLRQFIRGECQQSSIAELMEQQQDMLAMQQEYLARILKYSIRASVGLPIFVKHTTPDGAKVLNDETNKTGDAVLANNLEQMGVTDVG